MSYLATLFPQTGTTLGWGDLAVGGIHFDELERDAIINNRTDYELLFVRWLDIDEPAIASVVEDVDSRVYRQFTKEEQAILQTGNGGGANGEIPGVKDAEVINYYAELMARGVPFPPLLLSMPYDKLALWDGWHRLNAWRWLGVSGVPAVIVATNCMAIREYLDKSDTHEANQRLEISGMSAVSMELS